MDILEYVYIYIVYIRVLQNVLDIPGGFLARFFWTINSMTGT